MSKIEHLIWADAFPTLLSTPAVREFWERQIGMSATTTTPLETCRLLGDDRARLVLTAARASHETANLPLLNLSEHLNSLTGLEDLVPYYGISFSEALKFLRISTLSDLVCLSTKELDTRGGSDQQGVKVIMRTLAAFCFDQPAVLSPPAGRPSTTLKLSSHRDTAGEHRLQLGLTDMPFTSKSPEELQSLPDWARLVYELAIRAITEHGLDAPLFPMSLFRSEDYADIELLDTLLSLRASDVLDPSHSLPPTGVLNLQILTENFDSARIRAFELAGRELSTIWSEFTPREELVLRRRILTTSPDTLDTIGADVGVTRERVRQIASVLSERWETLIGESSYLRPLLASVEHSLADVQTVNSVIAQWPEFFEPTPIKNITLFDLLCADFSRKQCGNWLANRELGHWEKATRELADSLADNYGIVKYSDLEQALAKYVRAEEIETWIGHVGLVIYQTYVLTKTSSADKRAAGVLAVQDRPMSSQELAEATAALSIRTLKNALHSSDQIKRVGLDQYGLSAWDNPEYSSIRELIDQALTESGETMHIDDLAEKLAAQFNVSESSVRIYASSHPYVTQQGVVTRRSAAKQSKRPLWAAKGLFVINDRLLWRLRVTSDQMRGSGFSPPPALAHYLNLWPGDSLELKSEQGQQRLSWPSINPSFSSIRSILLSRGLKTGDDFIIVIDPNEKTFEVVKDPYAGLKGLALLNGIFHTSDPLSINRQLRTCLGFAPDTSLHDVMTAFEKRGEIEITNAITENFKLLESDTARVQTQVKPSGTLEGLLGDFV